MTHLVVLIHADPSVLPRYRQALGEMVRAPHELVLVNAGAYSSAYQQLARELRGRAPTLLESVIEHAGAGALSEYRSVTLASFSAGYALVREVLAEPASVEQLSGVVSIDSWQSALDPDGTAADSQLGGLVRWAMMCREPDSRRALWLAHTDVRTPQKGKHAAASTTQVARELRRLVGMRAEQVGAGNIRLRAYDKRQRDHAEHVYALLGWGPEWLAKAVAYLTGLLSVEAPEADEPPPTQPGEPLGLRCLRLCREEQLAGVREVPGSEHHPRILEYLAGCMRDGHRIGGALKADEVPWCAAAQGWALARAITPAESWPHKWRASVREIWADALASGAARGIARMRRGEYTPRIGDLLVLTRGGPAVGSGVGAFAKTHGKGHTGRIAVLHSGALTTLDANYGNKWTDVRRDLGSTAIVGIASYPELTPEVVTPDDDELDALYWLDAARLMAVSDAVARGESGLSSSGLEMLE